MKITYDFHTHTTYSHGKGTILENALSAKDKGVSGIAITDHGFSHPAFGMRRRRLDKMRAECTEAEKQTGVRVLLGIESNIRGRDGTIDVKPSDYGKLDVVLAGVHKFIMYRSVGDAYKLLLRNMWHDKLKIKATDKLIKYNTECYINAVKNNPIDILTHVGFGCACNAVEVAKACADYGTLFEISTKKNPLTDEEWQGVIDTGVCFSLDSDAHSVERIGDIELFEELVKRVNFPIERIMNIDGKAPSLRFAEFKKQKGIE